MENCNTVWQVAVVHKSRVLDMVLNKNKRNSNMHPDQRLEI